MDSGLKVDKTIKLPGLMSVLKEANDAKKNILFFDETGNLATFFKYKALLFELNKEIFAKLLGKQTIDQVKEKFRKMIVSSMKSGQNLAIQVDMSIPDFQDFYDPKYVHPDLFNRACMQKQENYQSMLREEDYLDAFGNKGPFIKRGGMISIVTRASVESEGENAKKYLPLQNFMIIKIED